MYRSAALVLGAVAAALLLGTVSVDHSARALALAGFGSLLAVLWHKPHLSVYFALAAALVPLPQNVPDQIRLAGFTIFLYEPFLYLATAILLARSARMVRLDRAYLVWVAYLALWIAGSVAIGIPSSRILSDVRGLIDMSVAYLLAMLALQSYSYKTFSRILLAALWVTLVASVLTSLGIVSLGTIDEAILYLQGGGVLGSETLRVRMPAEPLALVTLGAVIGLMLRRAISLPSALLWSAPCLGILFLSFSRNNILGVAVAVLAALLLMRTSQEFAGSLARGTILAGAAAIMVLAVVFVSSQLGYGWMMDQVDAYSQRVLEGLDTQTLSVDSSVQYRAFETEHGLEAIRESPVLGNGFGYAYLPSRGEAGSFQATRGMYYSHNFYLWIAIKGGIVGLAAFLAFALSPLNIRRARASAGPYFAGVLAVVSLLAISVVAPQPLGTPGAMILGCCLGAAASFRRSESPETHATRHAQPRQRAEAAGHLPATPAGTAG
jgi:O-antigen ligase